MVFTTDLIVKCADDNKWELQIHLSYSGRIETFIVPQGFITDFASVPRLLRSIFPKTGLYTKAAVIHDFLYATKMISRKDADGIFRRIMKESGVGRFTRYPMWAALRMFGWLGWNKA